MTYLEFLIRGAIRIRNIQGHGFHPVVKEIAGLYEDKEDCQKNHPGLAENRQEMPDRH